MRKKELIMEVFVLMGELNYAGDTILGVYASEEEAITARNIYTRDGEQGRAGYYVQRQVIGAGAEADFDNRRYI